jgi:LuxR family maltose regulon positive regulatory protein
MAALSVQNMDDIHGFVSTLSGSHHYIFDYLVEEILKRQSREIQRFLLYTSILDQLTAPLCDALLKEGAVPDITRPSTVILEELEHANLFILPLDHEQRWYRYHHLFSDLLRIMLEKTYPRRCTELHHRACLWYEAHGMLSDALDHALSSGDMKLVAQIVADNALVLVENDAAAPILKQIDALPLDQVTTLPWLGIARAWILGAGQIHKSEQILDAVEKSLEIVPEGCERQRIRGHIAAARAHVLGAKGDFNEALAHVKLAVDLLPEDEIAVRARCLTIWGDLLVGNGNVSQGIPYLEWAWTMAMRAKRPHVSMIAAASLANAYLFQGRMHELEHVCREALLISEIYEQRVQHPMLATSGVYALLARVLAEWGESEEAIPYARMGLRLSQRWGQDLDETFCLDYLARVLVFNNDWEQAKPLLDRAGLLAWKISAAMGLDRTFFTLDSLLDSEFPRPGEVEQEMRRIQVQGASYPALLAARLKLREEQPDQAFTILEQAESELKDQPSFDTIRIYALRALAYQALGNTKQALLALRQALDLGEPENRVATFVREGAVMEKLLRLAQASGMAPRFIQRLLLAFEMRRKHNQKRNLIGKGLVESVSERELDVIKLLAQGCSDKNIAEKLFISPETVHKHLKNIYGKLGVHSRTEALVQARKLELL